MAAEQQSEQAAERQNAEIAPEKEEAKVEAVADNLEYVKDEKKIIGKGNVVVTQEDIRLLADYAEVFTETKKTYAEGHVSLLQNKARIYGEQAFYNFSTNQGSFPNGNVSYAPFYISGEQIEQVSKQQVDVYQAIITTCALPHPHYDLKADRVVVYPGDKMIARNVKFRILNVPVFWWPYLVIPLNEETGPFEISFGQSKSFGNYVLLGKTFSVVPPVDGREIKTKFHVDHYHKRGTAVGNETWYHLDKIGDGNIKLYNIKDARAPDPFFFEEDEGWRKKKRYRVTWKHRTDFDERTNLIAQWNQFSDPHVLSNFFDEEFDEEPIPQSFVTFTRNAKNYGLLVDMQIQANNFDNVLERLPEIRFNLNSTEIGETGFYYDNSISYQNLHQITHSQSRDPSDGEGKRRLVSEIRQSLSEAQTSHQISRPMRLFRYYDFTPHISSQWIYDNRNHLGKRHVMRNIIGMGAEASTRFYRYWDVPKGSFLGGIQADRVRHVARPIVEYSAIRQSTTRPANIHPLGTNSPVSDVVKFGIENRIQTKSGKRRVDIVSLNTYVYYTFNDGNRDSRWTTGTIQLILRPYSWLQYKSEWTVDLKKHRTTATTTDLVLHTKYVDLQLNHRAVFAPKDSLASDLFFQRETNTITLDAVGRFNDRWTFGTYVRWEVKRMSFREYEWRVTRDLHDWMLTFGQNFKHSAINWLDNEFFFELTLKAFPSTPFNSGERAEFPDARIGESVSGANVAPPPNSLL